MHFAARGKEPPEHRSSASDQFHPVAAIGLRPVTAGDGPAIFAILANPAVAARLCSIPDPLTVTARERLLADLTKDRNGAPAARAIEVEGRFAGCVSLAPHEGSGALALTYWLSPDCWGRGVATAALRRALAETLDSTTVPGIFAETRGDNPASARVLQKLGFEPVGRGEGLSCGGRAISTPQFWLDRRRPLLSLETRRLVLTLPYAADIPRLVAFLGEMQIAKQTARIPHPYRRADAEAFVAGRATPGELAFAMRLKDEDGALIGGVGFGGIDGGVPELGYWLAQPYWGRGLATEAARAVIDLVFSNDDVREVHASSRVTNAASRHVLEKCGFQHCGTGLIRSRALGGSVPIDRFRLDRSTWLSILAWRPAIRRERPAGPESMGATP